METQLLLEQPEGSNVPQLPSAERPPRRRYLRHVERVFSLEEKQDALNRYDDLVKSGVNESVVLARFGLTYSLIHQWREEIEEKRKRDQKIKLVELPPEKPIEQKKREEALAKFHLFRESGMKSYEAAEATGVKYRTLLRWQKSGDKPVHGHGRPSLYSDEKKKEILAKYYDLRISGIKAHDAATQLGAVSLRTISRWEKMLVDLDRKSTKRIHCENKKKDDFTSSVYAGANNGQPNQCCTSRSSKIVHSLNNRNLTMTLKNGTRVLGLTVDQVIRIIKSV